MFEMFGRWTLLDAETQEAYERLSAQHGVSVEALIAVAPTVLANTLGVELFPGDFLFLQAARRFDESRAVRVVTGGGELCQHRSLPDGKI